MARADDERQGHMRPSFFAELDDKAQKDFCALERLLIARRIPPRIARALLAVARHRFVPAADRAHAFEDRPLAIGLGQTISQPSLVAEITAFAVRKAKARCLEVGCGSGYQAAVLAHLGAHVVTLERIAEHVVRARERLVAYESLPIEVVHTDGHEGWPSAAPYDVIVVSAAAAAMPEALLTQLAVGGRMVVPVDDARGGQTLWGITRHARGLRRRELMKVRFVPLLPGAVGRALV